MNGSKDIAEVAESFRLVGERRMGDTRRTVRSVEGPYERLCRNE